MQTVLNMEIDYQIMNGIILFLYLGYPSIFFLFHLFRGMAAAVNILNVEKTNNED